ncbi:M4 family metallopeptidase [Streptomyces sp. NPDC096132]|uniref:M4 family metallopeptidase n=1 Tax=Streptomyces sp. NPDC096132 TaxID=3366075 RepID=UPI003803815F
MDAARTFCSFVPPHILERMVQNEDPELAGRARRTLERDAYERTHRRLTTVVGAPSITAPVGAEAGKPHRTLYDARHRTDLPGKKVRAEGSDPGTDATVNRAYAGLGATFELFLKAYQRDSIDGAGVPLDASVHYDENYNNAFWNGEQMVFGDGDGEIFLDFTIPIDVIGHELTHGVTQYTANLTYFGQPGALNESMSDVFGSLIKQHTLGQTADEADWLIGAGLLAPRVTGSALRSMKAPGTAYDDDVLGKDPQPATMDGYVRTGRDNGGVHINSGIPNHAFYIVATTLGGHAWERAGQIWYDVLTGGQLKKDALFTDFANLTVKAARERFGDSDELEAVKKAWEQVGVLRATPISGPMFHGSITGSQIAIGGDVRQSNYYAGHVPPGHTPPGPDVGGDDDDEW